MPIELDAGRDCMRHGLAAAADSAVAPGPLPTACIPALPCRSDDAAAVDGFEREGAHHVPRERLAAAIPEGVDKDLVVPDRDRAHCGAEVKRAALEHHRVLVVHAGALREDEQRRGFRVPDVLMHALGHDLPVLHLHRHQAPLTAEARTGHSQARCAGVATAATCIFREASNRPPGMLAAGCLGRWRNMHGAVADGARKECCKAHGP